MCDRGAHPIRAGHHILLDLVGAAAAARAGVAGRGGGRVAEVERALQNRRRRSEAHLAAGRGACTPLVCIRGPNANVSVSVSSRAASGKVT